MSYFSILLFLRRDSLSLLLLSHPLDLVKQFDEVFDRQICTSPILFYSNQVCVHRLEAMNEVLHQDNLTYSIKLQDSDSQSVRMVTQAVNFRDHELRGGQPSQHGIRRIQWRHYTALVRVASLACEAG